MRVLPILLATSLVSAGAGFLVGRGVQPARQTSFPVRANVATMPAPQPSGIAVKPAAGQREASAPAVASSGVRALNIRRIALDAKGNKAQACLVFSGPVSTASDFHPADYLRIEPAIRPALQVNGERLCIGGLAFGVTYQVTVLAGLPGGDGSRKLADETLPLGLGDLPSNTDFADDGFILARDATKGLPIATVNVSHVHMRVERITDRVLVRTQLGADYSDNSLDTADHVLGRLVNTLGVPVWEGDLTVKGARNEKVTTAFPLAQVLPPHRLPGAYRISLLTKEADTRPSEGWDVSGTRWVFDTDLMLTTHRGADGLHVFVRSLTSANPVTGAEVSLLGANNDELGRIATNANGEAVFGAGLLRGAAGLVPRMVMAYAGDDFTALQLDKPGFDFSDRGVEGRPDPGPVDGYLYTDRGIYRPGETIQLGTVVRDGLAKPLPDGQAVSVVLHRPDGVEAARVRLVPNAVGVAVQAIALNATAPRGTWRLEEMLAGTKTVIGTLEVQVQDFVPNRLAVELAPRSPRITPSQPAIIDVASRYLYGAPAADLQVSAHVQLQRDTEPVPGHGWVFGRADEALNADAQDITGPNTDAQGHAALSIDAAALKIPQTTAPLRADVTVSVAEPGGRATESRTTLKVATHDVLIGLRAPNEEGSLVEDHASAVAVGVFAPDGSHLAKTVTFRLVEQVTEYNYYAVDGRWEWKTSTHDRAVTFGSLDVPAAEGGAPIGLPPLQWGTYRLEVSEQGGANGPSPGGANSPSPGGANSPSPGGANRAFSSIVLHVGFSGAPGADASPEKVAVSLQGSAPAAGQDATLHIKPPFAGQMLITVENSRVLAVQTASIPAEGADITVHADAGWGVGAYVMASVYRPSGQVSGHAPVRAVGLAYVKLDASARTIGVAMTVPAVLRPRTHLDLPVTVSGAAAHGQVWLTLAAVDEGILDLTRFASPDPAEHYFGKRRLAVDVRDDYAHLIDGNGAAAGEIRAGGDLDGAGLTVVPTRTTALFSGLVAVGADGHATVPLELPDFTGGLRLMAVAVSEAGFGHAEQQVPVRDPVVAQVSLPRFLAPGDAAKLTLLAHNVEAPSGTFHVHLSAEGALGMQPVDDDIHLDAKQAVVRTYPLAGGAVGTGRVVLVLTGPASPGGGGMDITHDWPMEVRTPFQSVTLVTKADQAAGETATLSAALATGLVPQGAVLRASFSNIGNIDLPGLLAALDEYPFGCSEQLVSRAMPLIYVEQEAKLVGSALPPDLRFRVQDAVDKLLERQDDSGAFGLWRAGDGEAEPFLGAMIADFLTRAQAHGYTVPQHALASAMRVLTQASPDGYQLHRFWFLTDKPGEIAEAVTRAGRAYALLLAARTGQADAADLRYMHDNDLDKMEPLGQAQLAAGLAMLGDHPRAVHAFDMAEGGLPHERDGLEWRIGDFYRTRLRDTAAMVVLAAEIGDRPRVRRLLASLDRFDTRTEDLTTQEQGWLVIAAGVLLERAGPASVSVDGAAQPKAAVVSLSRDVAGLHDIAVRNTGAHPLTRIVSVRGLPTSAPAASSSHVTIEKAVTAADGSAVDLDHLTQNQRLVVHLSGDVDDHAYHQSMLVDPLPAGFEIERVVPASTKTEGNGLAWVGPITSTRIAEKRDDRFMAAIDLGRVVSDTVDEDEAKDADKEAAPDPQHFNLAYVVRVVSPGRFVLPAASIRDMYRPDVQARTAVGSVTVQGK